MSSLDVAILASYGALLLLIGARVAAGRQTATDFTLGGRNLPTWAVLCSMTATELSAATFIGVPHAAYTGDWSYLQLAVGALLAKGVLARHVIPLYHRMGIVTVYGFLAERFGAQPQRGAALCFLGGRLLASGARLFIAGLALSAVSDVPIQWAVAGCGFVAGVYTMVGGIRAVIWTDTLQAGLLLAGALTVLVVLAAATPQGLHGLLDWANAEGRSQILHLEPLFSISDSRALGTALIGAFFLTLATHSTDHDMVQRLLTTRSAEGGGRALLGSALVNFPLTLIFLMIGTGLAHFYATPPAYPIDDSTRILPLFALHELPSGLRGLLFAGLFAAAMSSLDSAICALATTFTHDIRPAPPNSAHPLRRMRASSALLTLLLVGAAMGLAKYHALLAARGSELNLVEFALSSMTILYGGLLGIFALGISTRHRGSPASVLAGLALGSGIGLLLFLHPVILGRTWLAWPWWIPISAASAYAVAATGRATKVFERPKPHYPLAGAN
jgi:SSS family transporter